MPPYALNSSELQNKPREVVDADEGAVARRVAARIAADSLRRPRHAGRNDPMFHEPHWGHTSGLLRGALVVDRIDALPARFRVGLFSAPGTFPLVARAGIAKDATLGFAINRVALKLKYPRPVPNVYAPDGTAPELDLLLAEGQPGVNATGHPASPPHHGDRAGQGPGRGFRPLRPVRHARLHPDARSLRSAQGGHGG